MKTREGTMLHKTKYVLLGVFLSALGLWGLAVTIPHTFQDGDVVSSSKMNQNFTALKNAVDMLEAKLAEVQTGQLALPTKAGQLGYALVKADGSLWPDTNFNSSGGPVTPSKNAVGSYAVDFSGLDFGRGNVQVTATDPGMHCIVDWWNSTTVFVLCSDDTGTPADSAFNVLVLK